MKPVITAADLERIPQNGEFSITADTLITPLAREEAERRGIRFKVAAPAGAESISAATSNSDFAQRPERTVAIGADHGGFELKEQLKGYLREWGYPVLDLGTH